MAEIGVVIVAGGSGKRMGAALPKQFMMLGNLTADGSALLLERYGNTLKSDAVQVPAFSAHISSATLRGLSMSGV